MESNYARSGHNNNILFVLPAWNMVVARLGLDEQKSSGGFPLTNATYSEFFKRVGAAIRDPIVEGELRIWHPITVSFRGPLADESDDQPNPFLDYRLQVKFTGPSGQTYDVRSGLGIAEPSIPSGLSNGHAKPGRRGFSALGAT